MLVSGVIHKRCILYVYKLNERIKTKNKVRVQGMGTVNTLPTCIQAPWIPPLQLFTYQSKVAIGGSGLGFVYQGTMFAGYSQYMYIYLNPKTFEEY